MSEEGVAGCLLGVAVLIIVGFMGFSLFFSTMEPTQGSHTGFITAVEKSGVIWKTGRAYVKTDTQSSQEDQYCVRNQEVYDQLVKAQTSKEKVTIKFDAPLVIGNWECGGENAIIYAVEPSN